MFILRHQAWKSLGNTSFLQGSLEISFESLKILEKQQRILNDLSMKID